VWLIAVIWLAHAQLQHELLFDPTAKYHVQTLIEGIIPAAVIEVFAFFGVAAAGKAPTRWAERREWMYSFVWALFPNLMVLYTVHLMVLGEI
jgi:hypothetical protein